MFFVGLALAVIGYALTYSGVQSLRAGPDGPSTGVLESLSPTFDALAREQAIRAKAAG